eukprot:jgi/Bigna1/84172/fgenesh1_pg.125_\
MLSNIVSQIDLTLLARALGYVVGAGSLLLYTPIILSLVSGKGENVAKGLTLATWWLKLAAYTASNVYCFTKGFPLSQYIETVIITGQAAVLVGLVSIRKNQLFTTQFASLAAVYAVMTTWALTTAPQSAIAFGQAAASLVASLAVLPQLKQNFLRKDPGGYSPITAALSCGGCLIRLFTTSQ